MLRHRMGLWVVACLALAGTVIGCGGEECRVDTVDVHFAPSNVADGLYQADVAIDRCGGEGSEAWRLEVECVGSCPEFTARVFLENYIVAEQPASSLAPAVIESHQTMNGDVNEYRLYVQVPESDVGGESYTFVGHFTGSSPSIL